MVSTVDAGQPGSSLPAQGATPSTSLTSPANRSLTFGTATARTAQTIVRAPGGARLILAPYPSRYLVPGVQPLTTSSVPHLVPEIQLPLHAHQKPPPLSFYYFVYY